jgi:hypothetical protein
VRGCEADLCAEAIERRLELHVEPLAADGKDLVDLLGDDLHALADGRLGQVILSNPVAHPVPEDAFPFPAAVPLLFAVRLLGVRRHAQAARGSTRRVDGWQLRW